MTPEEIDQLAAARMHAARLHSALKDARDAIAEPLRDVSARNLLEAIDAALNSGEPFDLDLIAKARAVVAALPANGDCDPLALCAAVTALDAALPAEAPT